MDYLKGLKVCGSNARSNEKLVRVKSGRTRKSLYQIIVKDFFGKYDVCMYKYHGGNIEGFSCRRLSSNATKIFKESAATIKEFNYN